MKRINKYLLRGTIICLIVGLFTIPIQIIGYNVNVDDIGDVKSVETVYAKKAKNTGFNYIPKSWQGKYVTTDGKRSVTIKKNIIIFKNFKYNGKTINGTRNLETFVVPSHSCQFRVVCKGKNKISFWLQDAPKRYIIKGYGVGHKYKKKWYYIANALTEC